MIQLNLLPDIKKEFIRAQRTRNSVIAGSVIAIAVSIGLITLFTLYVYVGQPLIAKQLTDDIKSKGEQLQAVPDIDKYLTVQHQLESLGPLHDNKKVYSRIMDFMPALNPVAPHSIQLNTLEVNDAEGTVVFKGISPSAKSFNIFKDTLINAQLAYQDESGNVVENENLFSTVTVEANAIGRVRDQTVVTFAVKAVYSDSAFAATTSGINVRVPRGETTQSAFSAPSFTPVEAEEGGAR